MSLILIRWNSLRTRITVVTLGIFLAGIWSLAFFETQALQRDMRNALTDRQMAAAVLLAGQIDREIRERGNTISAVASVAAGALSEGPVALQHYLSGRHDLLNQFNSRVFVTDADGVAIASLPADSGMVGLDYGDRDYIAVALREGRTNVGRPVIGKTTGMPVVGIAAPIWNSQGKIVGAAAGVIDLTQPSFFDDMTEKRFGRSGDFAIVAPQYRMIVTGTDKRRVMESMPPPGANRGMDAMLVSEDVRGMLAVRKGSEIIVSGKRIPAAGWQVSVSTPVSEAFAEIQGMQRRLLVAAIVLTAMAGLLTWWYLRRELSPLTRATDALTRGEADNGPYRSLPIVRDDEIGRLLGAFNRQTQLLQERETMLRQILNTSSVGVFLVTREGTISLASEQMSEMFGRPVAEIVGGRYSALLPPEDREAVREAFLPLLSGRIPPLERDRIFARADATRFWGHLTIRPFFDAHGNACGAIGVISDIDRRKRAEQSLRESKERYDDMAARIPVGIYSFRESATEGFVSQYLSPKTAELLGLPVDALMEDMFAVLNVILPEDQESFVAANRKAFRERNPLEATARVLSGGSTRWLRFAASPEVHENGDVLWHGVLTDITEAKEYEKRLEFMAHYDPLTALPNRVLLADRLRQSMAHAVRRASLLGVAYLDFDGFKAINDSHGHQVGDQYLVALAERMKHLLRAEDTLARLGGDEFAIVLEDLTSRTVAEAILDRLLGSLERPVRIGELSLNLSASLGVTFFPQDEPVDADQVLRQADQAMYQAKLAGKNRYHVFDPDLDRDTRGRHEALLDIQRALAEHEFELHYQPKVNLRTGTILGAEALIRWRHPERGLIPPGVFLPVIENDALAVQVGEWVMDAAIRQMAEWQSGGVRIPVSVNVGAYQLQQSDFVARLTAILARYPDVPPADLMLEVLETSALNDLAHVAAVIDACRVRGVLFALDDFGTGYSSLSYLKQLNVHQIKIDQSFVRDMLHDADDRTILEGIVGLASAFRREVIAEGVETPEHGRRLIQLGCDLAQGYGIARPMPAADLSRWVENWRRAPGFLLEKANPDANKEDGCRLC